MNAELLTRAIGAWRTGTQPLYAELADAIAVAVRTGSVPAGARLPAERALAAALDVSRGTVVAAYDQLRGDGLATTRHGSGTIVGDPELRGGERDEQSAASLSGPHIFHHLLHPTEGAIDLATADWEGGAENLPADLFDLSGPDAVAALRSSGYWPTGLPRLREAVAGWLTDHHVPTAVDQILVTTGAHQAISLLTQYKVGAGDAVVTEELTYPGAINVFRAAGAQVRVARHTSHGVDVASLERTVAATAPKLVYLVPDGHNPTGTVTADLTKRRVAELAPRWDAMVVEDASLWPLQFDGRLRSPIAGMRASTDEGVLVGSVSKISWGGLRVGWVRGPADLVGRLARLKLLDDLGSAIIGQVVAARILERSDELFPRRRQEVVDRYTHLAGELRTHLPEWRWQPPVSGLTLWVHLPGEDAAAFCHVAAHHGVHVVPGTVAAPGGGAGDRIRLPLGKSAAQHREGVRRLAAAWQEYRSTYHRPDRVRVLV